MERYKRASKADQQDQYVLTVFLPLLAVAILACIGGCCYMERRRRRRKKKNGGVDPEELRQQQDFDDTASVISTSSSRRRHYLDPTPTTGRLVRGAAVRSNYSTVGEPLYGVGKRIRSSTRCRQDYFDYDHDHTWGTRSGYGDTRQQRPSNRHRDGHGERPPSRSRSMVDMRYGSEEDDGGLRRTRSSTSLGRYRNSLADSGYQENQSNDSEIENMYEFLNGGKPGQEPEEKVQYKYNRPRSPTQSDWSVATAPPRSGYEKKVPMSLRPSSRPSSMVDFPLRNPARLDAPNRPLSLTRSLSQPNLKFMESKTYPQGILKKGPQNEDRRLPGMSYQASTHSGMQEGYGDVGDISGRSSRISRQHTALNEISDGTNMWPGSRPPSVLGFSNGRQNYDPYFTPRYGNYQNGYHHHQPYGFRHDQPPGYSASVSNYHHHQFPADKYAHSSDPHGSHDEYWNQQSHRSRMPMY